VTSSSQRLLSLQRQHRDVLRKIGNKQKEVERLRVMVAEAEHQFMERVEPLAARCRTTNEEIWRMFESVLSSQKTKRTRRAVRDVFHALIRHGVLDPVEAEVGAEFEDHGEPDAAESGARAHPGPGLGGHSAAPRGAEPGRDSLKAVFKRLTLAFHPDRTRDAEEKLARTALMQNVTHAYQTGDLAGLLRLEQKSGAAATPASGRDQVAQCLAIQRVLDELRVQLAELKQEARRLERAEALQFFRTEHAGGSKKSFDHLVRSLEAELDELVRIRDFVAAFRDKLLTLDEFMCGPRFQFGGAEFDFDDLLRDSAVEPSELGVRSRRGARRKQSRRRRE